MNLLHFKYAIEVAKYGSMSKASEVLLIAVPNLSRSIKELETDLNITIFERTKTGMKLTQEGEEFVGFAKGILAQIEEVESLYKAGSYQKQKFSLMAPYGYYISEAFANFSAGVSGNYVDVMYKEADSRNTITSIQDNSYKLGIIRYDENYDKYYKSILEEKNFQYELVAEFSLMLAINKNNPLADKQSIECRELCRYIEITDSDPYVPLPPVSKANNSDLSYDVKRKMYVSEHSNRLSILSQNTEAFMWSLPMPESMLEYHNIVLKKCIDNNIIYKDMLLYKNGYKLSRLERQFITELCKSKRKYI